MAGTCIAMMVNDAFIEGAVTFLFSLRRHNPWLDADLVVFHSRNWLPLSTHSRALLAGVHPRPRFLEVDEGLYDNIDFAPAEDHFNRQAEGRRHCGKIMYAKFHVFGLAAYDRVVYFDSDLLCTGDVRPLFEVEADLAACRRGIVWDDGMRNVVATGDHCFNAGVLSIGRRYLGDHMMPALLEAGAEGHWMGDQGALYRYFEGKAVRYLDSRYNANADHFTEWHTGPIQDFEDASIIHITRKKPWEKEAHEKDDCDRLWDRVREDCDRDLRDRLSIGFSPRPRRQRKAASADYRALADPAIKKIGWAAGGTYRLVSDLYPLDLAYLVDADETLWGTRIGGVEVRAPTALADEDPDRSLVVIYSGLGRTIRGELAKLGPFPSIGAPQLLELPALPDHDLPTKDLALRAIEKAFAMAVVSLAPDARFAICGGGDLGRLVLSMCRSRDLEPVVILDDAEGCGELDGVPVRPIAEGIREHFPDDIVFANLDRRRAMVRASKSRTRRVRTSAPLPALVGK